MIKIKITTVAKMRIPISTAFTLMKMVSLSLVSVWLVVSVSVVMLRSKS